jgi:hypothetical protein
MGLKSNYENLEKKYESENSYYIEVGREKPCRLNIMQTQQMALEKLTIKVITHCTNRAFKHKNNQH